MTKSPRPRAWLQGQHVHPSVDHVYALDEDGEHVYLHVADGAWQALKRAFSGATAGSYVTRHLQRRRAATLQPMYGRGRWLLLAAGLCGAACGGKKTHDVDASGGRAGAAAAGEPPCEDGLVNGDETDVDCGGETCAPCPDGARCERGEDCQNRLCLDEACEPATCVDGVRNGDETDIDCDGECSPCPSCDDGVRNFGESDVDCGGGGGCAPCPLDRECYIDEDCASGVCLSRDKVPISRCSRADCRNQRRDGNETDVDCGGPDCDFCHLGQSCQTLPDCGGAHCDGFCQQPCESIQECGGLGTCENGLCVYCRTAADCAPGQCGTDDCLCRNGYCSRY